MSELPRKSDAVARALAYEKGTTISSTEALALGLELESDRQFGHARRVLSRLKESAPRFSPLEVGHHLCHCTYKDADLPAALRLGRALEVLEDLGGLSSTGNQQTLGMAGAIHRRLFDLDNQRVHLDRALHFFTRADSCGTAGDRGYGATNAAFVLDQLAMLEEEEARNLGAVPPDPSPRRRAAAELRNKVIPALHGLLAAGEPALTDEARWWLHTTLAEAHLGLNQLPLARAQMEAAAKVPAREWWRESTIREFAALCCVNKASGSDEAVKMLHEVLGVPERVIRNVFRGKFGLGLSGGGFRASLFHIGVLAALAERDLLRDLEVLSCVSGGSIIGAHYYLEVQHLLETTPDSAIGAKHYVEIVERVCTDFLVGVQKNLRTRVGANLIDNLKMIFVRRYSRTERLGDLLEQHLFSKATGRPRVLMSDLIVNPLREGDSKGGDFSPKRDNWLREAKVPILVLNATTLNTGHNWQFTATWMGEPPSAIDNEVDGNFRLRRMYYRSAPAPFDQFRLGHAVAASACVPGLFEPIVLDGLYPATTVRLVDGGVQDNQGVVGLLEQDVRNMLVSDASGQMEAQLDPSGSVLGVPLRSNSILMARVRDAQYSDLKARKRSALLNGLTFLHLKKDLNVESIDWNKCDSPLDPLLRESERKHSDCVVTTYGVQKEVQERLSALRTDLDSFNEVEAYALMYSGYRMAAGELDRDSPPGKPRTRHRWRFLDIERPMQEREGPGMSAANDKLLRFLTVGADQAFKIWRLSSALKVLSTVLAVAAMGLFARLAYEYWNAPLITVRGVVLAVIGALTAGGVARLGLRLVRWRDTLTQLAIGTGLGVFGAAAAFIHLQFFDRWYLALGRVRNLFGKTPAAIRSPAPKPPEP